MAFIPTYPHVPFIVFKFSFLKHHQIVSPRGTRGFKPWNREFHEEELIQGIAHRLFPHLPHLTQLPHWDNWPTFPETSSIPCPYQLRTMSVPTPINEDLRGILYGKVVCGNRQKRMPAPKEVEHPLHHIVSILFAIPTSPRTIGAHHSG